MRLFGRHIPAAKAEFGFPNKDIARRVGFPNDKYYMRRSTGLTLGCRAGLTRYLFIVQFGQNTPVSALGVFGDGLPNMSESCRKTKTYTMRRSWCEGPAALARLAAARWFCVFSCLKTMA
jgi:hypothetical protein